MSRRDDQERRLPADHAGSAALGEQTDSSQGPSSMGGGRKVGEPMRSRISKYSDIAPPAEGGITVNDPLRQRQVDSLPHRPTSAGAEVEMSALASIPRSPPAKLSMVASLSAPIVAETQPPYRRADFRLGTFVPVHGRCAGAPYK
jgi:hypothetical protein